MLKCNNETRSKLVFDSKDKIIFLSVTYVTVCIIVLFKHAIQIFLITCNQTYNKSVVEYIF